MSQLKEECRSLADECQSLTNDNKELSCKLLQLQQQQVGCDDVYLALRVEGEAEQEGQLVEEEPVKADGYITLSQSQPEHQGTQPADASIQENISNDGTSSELSSLKVQLRQAEEKAQQVQRECEGLKGELAELQELYDSSQQEREALEQELQCCKAELEKLVGRKSQNCTPPSEPPVLSIPFIGMIVIVALIWCWWEELAS
ncbi:uncharacterized protein LOC139921313 [Centroberyx gerrardi]